MNKKSKKVKPIKSIIEKLDIATSIKDYKKFPFPYKDKSVKEITVVGVLEYIEGKLRGKFIDELYRILTDDGQVNIIVPYWNSAMGIQDYRYEFPTLTEQSFLYFNKGWRDANNLKLDIVCDFDFSYGYSCPADIEARNVETKTLFIKQNSNSVNALQILLTKRKTS